MALDPKIRWMVLIVCLCGGARARADSISREDPPRWRIRAGLSTGFGGASVHGDAVTVFPTHLEVGLRLFGPLSFDLRATAIQVGEVIGVCGELRRPSALLGAAGLRFDLFNRRSESWVDPFVEVHGGTGGQLGCSSSQTFATGGARAGIDVWLGRVAVSITASYDYLPVAAPFAGELGATVALY